MEPDTTYIFRLWVRIVDDLTGCGAGCGGGSGCITPYAGTKAQGVSGGPFPVTTGGSSGCADYECCGPDIQGCGDTIAKIPVCKVGCPWSPPCCSGGNPAWSVFGLSYNKKDYPAWENSGTTKGTPADIYKSGFAIQFGTKDTPVPEFPYKYAQDIHCFKTITITLRPGNNAKQLFQTEFDGAGTAVGSTPLPPFTQSDDYYMQWTYEPTGTSNEWVLTSKQTNDYSFAAPTMSDTKWPIGAKYPIAGANQLFEIPSFVQGDPTALATDILPVQGGNYQLFFQALMGSGNNCKGKDPGASDGWTQLILGNRFNPVPKPDKGDGPPLVAGSIASTAKCGPYASMYKNLTNMTMWGQSAPPEIFGTQKTGVGDWNAPDTVENMIKFSRWYLTFIFYVAGKNVNAAGASTVLSKVSLVMQGMRMAQRGTRWIGGDTDEGGGFNMWAFPGDLAPVHGANFPSSGDPAAAKPTDYTTARLEFPDGVPYPNARPNPNRTSVPGYTPQGATDPLPGTGLPGVNSENYPPELSKIWSVATAYNSGEPTGADWFQGNPQTATYDYDYVPSCEKTVPTTAGDFNQPVNMPWVVKYFILPLYYENTGLFDGSGNILKPPSAWTARKLTQNIRYGWVIDQSTSLPWRTYATQFPFHPKARYTNPNKAPFKPTGDTPSNTITGGSNEWYTHKASSVVVNTGCGNKGGEYCTPDYNPITDPSGTQYFTDYLNYTTQQCGGMSALQAPATYYLYRGPPQTKSGSEVTSWGRADYGWDVPYKATYHMSAINSKTGNNGYIYGHDATAGVSYDPYTSAGSADPGYKAVAYQEGANVAGYTPSNYLVAAPTTSAALQEANAPNQLDKDKLIETGRPPILPGTTINPGNNMYQAFRQMSDIQYYILRTLELWNVGSAGTAVPIRPPVTPPLNNVPLGLLQSPFMAQDTEGGGGVWAGEAMLGAGAYVMGVSGGNVVPNTPKACTAAQGATTGPALGIQTQTEIYFPNNYSIAAPTAGNPPIVAPNETRNSCLSTKFSDIQLKYLRAGGVAPSGCPHQHPRYRRSTDKQSRLHQRAMVILLKGRVV